jgi:2,4-dienoyl-CoA reductase-like NADH-dependent reductase (Old Yellow Enzyme family)
LTDVSSLFEPFRIKSLALKNRVVMAPMTRSRAPEGTPGEANAAYYRRRAENEVGLILSEGTVIDRPASRNEAGIPFFHGEAALKGWRGVIESVHAAGGKMGPQIWHVGSVPGQGGWQPEAHGYLIDQFFWAGTNTRNDPYHGATVKERARFAAEVIAATRAAVGPDFPIFLRVSQWKQQDSAVKLATTPDAMVDWLGPLVAAGVDVLHCSQRRFWEPEFPEIDGEAGLNFAGWAKKLTGAATVSVGSVGLSGDMISSFMGQSSEATDLDRLVARMERGEFDLIAVGRALLSDYAWARKVHDGDFAALKGFETSALAELV